MGRVRWTGDKTKAGETTIYNDSMKAFSAIDILDVSLIQKPRGFILSPYSEGDHKKPKLFFLHRRKPQEKRKNEKKALWYSMSSSDPNSCRFSDASPSWDDKT
jgi:hypothetical protein